MKNTIVQVQLALSKVQKQHIQLAFVVLTLIMLVLGAGAPEDGGGVGR